MAERLWETATGPEWLAASAARLDEGHFAQMSIHNDWLAEEKERLWWQEWEAAWSWQWQGKSWSYSDWSSGGWSWRKRQWKAQEPTALSSSQMPASSGAWAEDREPGSITMEKVHEDMGTHRLTNLTPLSFQPQRHITMILGRPVVVLMWSKMLTPTL